MNMGIQATVNIMNSRATVRVDIGFYIRDYIMAVLHSVYIYVYLYLYIYIYDPSLFGQPVVLTSCHKLRGLFETGVMGLLEKGSGV